jgi:hypothetical protein
MLAMLRTFMLAMACTAIAVTTGFTDETDSEPPVPNGDPTDPHDGTIHQSAEVAPPDWVDQALVLLRRFAPWVAR